MDRFHQFVKAPRNLALCHNRSALAIEAECEAIPCSTNEEAEVKTCMYISAALLRAFSIELLFKALHYSLTLEEPPRTHSLKQLFDGLTVVASQQRIENDVSKVISPRSFRDVLDEIADTFVDWRYIHQEFGTGAAPGFDSDEMTAFVNAASSELDHQIRQYQSTT